LPKVKLFKLVLSVREKLLQFKSALKNNAFLTIFLLMLVDDRTRRVLRAATWVQSLIKSQKHKKIPAQSQSASPFPQRQRPGGFGFNQTPSAPSKPSEVSSLFAHAPFYLFTCLPVYVFMLSRSFFAALIV
jgi:hypothetical protein